MLNLIQNAKPPIKLFICLLCFRSFTKHDQLLQHRQFCHQQKNASNIVKKKILVNQPIQNMSYQCELCKKTFLRPLLLENHQWSKHKKIKKWMCHLCEKSFAFYGNLKQHLKNDHESKTLSCVLCCKKYSSLRGLKFHIKTIHLKTI